VFCGAGSRQTAGIVLLYAGLEVGTRDDLDIQIRKGYKGYSLGVLLGHRADLYLSYRPRF
jgi:hypothetical protein